MLLEVFLKRLIPPLTLPLPMLKVKFNRTILLIWDITSQLNKVSKEIKVSMASNLKSSEMRAAASEAVIEETAVTEGIEEVIEMKEVIEVFEMIEEIVMTATEIEIEMIEIAEIVEIEVIEAKEEVVETTEVTEVIEVIEVIEGREGLIQETKEVITTKEIAIPVADLVVIVESSKERMLTAESQGLIKTEKVTIDLVTETTLINPTTTDSPLEVVVIICLF